MQIRTLIRLTRSGQLLNGIKNHPDFQRMLHMNYSTKISNSLCDTLLKVIENKYGFKVEIFDFMGDKYSFRVNNIAYGGKIFAWKTELDAKINALIFLLKKQGGHETITT